MHAVALAAVGLFVAAVFAGTLTAAFAVTPPHVVLGSQQGDTDACAICHRAHTADATVPYRAFESSQTTGTSLLIASDPAAGDVSLCLSCHGPARLGSNTDVKSRFLLSSVHGLAPAAAAYGPTPLYCSTCHDSHGDARVASDTPYPKLLRSYEGTRAVYTGEAYCATCHTVKAAVDQGERWAGMDVYRQTGHYTGIPAPASGTGIRCSICHDPHGSAVAPLLAASLVPTSVPTTFTVTADDRTFCTACHGPAKASWEGTTAYASSSHGSSAETVAISAKWVPAGARRVGECQVCHAPMGRSDGSGGAIPKLLDAAGRALCDRCHSSTGVAHSTDTSSQAYPVSQSVAPELVAVYAPDPATWMGRVSVYGRALSGAAPRPLIGPKQYTPAQGTGPAAAGDIDPSTSKAYLVVAAADSPVVTVYAPDPLTGISPTATAPVPAGVPVASLAVANVMANGVGWIRDTAEVVGVTTNGRLVVYRWTGSVLATVSVTTLPAGPWGLATGDLTGTGYASIVVTNAGDHSVTIVSYGVSGDAEIVTTAVAGSPMAPSIGTSPGGSREIVVCDDSVSPTGTVRILDTSGAELKGYLITSGTRVPVASAIGDVLPKSAGSEVAVAFTDAATGDSSVVVIPQTAPDPGLTLDARVENVMGAGFRTGTLLIGDVEGDTHDELVVGNGGNWAVGAEVAPSVQVWRADGTGAAFALPTPYLGGGTDMAGAAPSLALADFGPVLPSRHPIDEVAPTAHNSTETASVARHVTCSDCHNTHESTVTVGPGAPLVPGPLKGSFGVTVTVAAGVPTFGAPARSATAYGVCFKCHSSYASSLGDRPDLALAFDSGNPSVHAIEAPSGTANVAASTFVTGWNSSSVLYCTDCHGDDGATPTRDLHESAAAPLLSKPYLGVKPSDPTLLCYDCHKVGVYATKAAEAPAEAAASGFTSPGKLLHAIHVAAPVDGGHGISCSACHVSHGSATLPHLLRSDGFVYTDFGPGGRSCSTDCHAAAYSY